MIPEIEYYSEIIWFDILHGRNEPEIGTVIGEWEHDGQTMYSIIWLEGYKSRNDDVPPERVFAIFDSAGPALDFGGIVGNGYITEHGQRWLDQQRKDPS